MTDGTKTLLVIAGVTGVTATVLSYLTRDSRRDYATGIRGIGTKRPGVRRFSQDWLAKKCTAQIVKDHLDENPDYYGPGLPNCPRGEKLVCA